MINREALNKREVTPSRKNIAGTGQTIDSLHNDVGTGAPGAVVSNQPNREQMQARVPYTALTSRSTPLTKAQSLLLTAEALIL